MKFEVLIVLAIAAGCSNEAKTSDTVSSKQEILRLLAIQETAYDNQTEENLKKFKDTCADSIIFIGGDDGGMLTSAETYLNDLADGYMVKPHDQTIRFYNNTAIVTSLHQGYKIIANDTLFLNSRSTKVFANDNNEWKMVYVTYAPLPVLYNKPVKVDPSKLAHYKGIYESGENLRDSVFVEEGKLYSDVAHTGKSELVPINDSTFIGHGYFGKVIFAPTHYTFEWNDGQRIRFKRIK